MAFSYNIAGTTENNILLLNGPVALNGIQWYSMVYYWLFCKGNYHMKISIKISLSLKVVVKYVR